MRESIDAKQHPTLLIQSRWLSTNSSMVRNATFVSTRYPNIQSCPTVSFLHPHRVEVGGSKIEPIRVAQLSNLAMTYNISCSSMKKKCLKFLDVLTEFDLFAPNITVRYQSDNDFKTLTGAILSFALIVFFGVIFVNRFTVMLNRTEITASVLKQEELDPRYYNTSTPNFLFAIGVIFMPLSSPTLI